MSNHSEFYCDKRWWTWHCSSDCWNVQIISLLTPVNSPSPIYVWACAHIFTGRMPFLPPNQRCQTAESDIITPGVLWETIVVPDLSWIVLQKYSGDGPASVAQVTETQCDRGGLSEEPEFNSRGRPIDFVFGFQGCMLW